MKSWLRGWKLWVVIALAVTGFLLLLAQDQDTVRVQSPVAVSDTRFADYLASLVGTSVLHGDAYTVLRNGDQVFPAMLDAIKQAQSRISMESFIYEDGQVGDQFTLALSDAARRGVTVRIVLDAIGGELSSDSQKTLTDAGVMLVWFNTIRPWTLEEMNYRTHRKVLIVDGSVGFTGGIGLADHWIGNADSEEHWRDTQVKVAGPAVRALEASFYENWLESGGQVVPALDPERSIADTGTRSVVVWSNPTAGVSNVKLLYLLAIAGARRQIDIQSPYVLLDESTRWSIDEARQRGVKVRILTDGEITDAMSVRYASRDWYEGLLANGVEVYEFQPTMMHVKAMIVDGVLSIAGSANFDNRSFELNDEISIAVSDAQLAGELTRDFEHDLTRSTQLLLEEWKRRAFREKVLERFWGLFGELF